MVEAEVAGLPAQTFKDYQSYCSYSAILCVILGYSLTPSLPFP